MCLDVTIVNSSMQRWVESGSKGFESESLLFAKSESESTQVCNGFES